MFLTVEQLGLTLSSAATQDRLSTSPPKKIRAEYLGCTSDKAEETVCKLMEKHIN